MKLKNYAPQHWTKRDKFALRFFLFFVSICLLGWMVNLYTQKPLISPIGTIEVEKVIASSREEVVNCETPRGYLECKAYKGEITWKEYELLNKIIMCESSWNPNAYHVNKNGTLDRGLFQSNSIHKDLSNDEAFDFKKNIEWGVKLFKNQGVKPWKSSRSCWSR